MCRLIELTLFLCPRMMQNKLMSNVHLNKQFCDDKSRFKFLQSNVSVGVQLLNMN